MDSRPPEVDESGQGADVDLAIRTSSASASAPAMHASFAPHLLFELSLQSRPFRPQLFQLDNL
jgi:hypothetical protein